MKSTLAQAHEMVYNGTVKKPTKAEAESIIIELCKGANPDTIPDLAKLWKYFQTKPKAKATKDPQAWLEQACSVDETRWVLNFAYSKDGFMVATDGRRLHCMPTDKPEGFYRDGLPVTDDIGTFPNWKQVIPNCKPDQYEKAVFSHSQLTTPTHLAKTGYGTRKDQPLKVVKIGGGYYAAEYLMEAMAYDENGTVYYDKDGVSPTKIELAEGRTVVLMPRRDTDANTEPVCE